MQKLFSVILAILILSSGKHVYAQFGEPEVIESEASRNLYDEGYKRGFAFVFGVNDFGFGAGSEYRIGISPLNEAWVSLMVSGVKDSKEQTFIDYYFGLKTIPDKYKRVMAVPLKVGLKRRLFAEQIADNFRIFATVGGGPVYALSFDYFNDSNNNGFQENDIFIYGFNERRYDLLSGFKNTKSHFGWTGDLAMGIDFGSNFAKITSIKFGYNFLYFKDGIQIMQPFRPDLNAEGNLQYDEFENLIVEKFYDPRTFMGSAQITFSFGWMWN